MKQAARYRNRDEPYFPDMVLAVASMRREGYTFAIIGETLGCTRMNAYQAYRRWKHWADAELARRKEVAQ